MQPGVVVVEHTAPLRIGIVFVGLRERTPKALQYLLVSLNRLQRTFEYELVPPLAKLDHPCLAALASRAPVDRDDLKSQLADLNATLQARLAEENERYVLAEPPPPRFIVISMASFQDTYYTARRGGVCVLALGSWKRRMSPPSLVEFILALVVRESLALSCKALSPSVHYGTKGCICDFTAALADVRLKVMSGFICHWCRATLLAHGRQDALEAATRMLDKSWLGDLQTPDSPAAVAAKLGHNLFLTKGLHPTFLERVRGAVEVEGARLALKALVALAGVALATFLGIHLLS